MLRNSRLRMLLPAAIRSRPRLAISLALGCVMFEIIPQRLALDSGLRFLAAWNISVLLYLVLVAGQMRKASPGQMEKRALDQEVGRKAVLAFAVCSSFVMLYAIGSMLAMVKELNGRQQIVHLVVAGLTVITSWLFTQVAFAQHYAHDFYLARMCKQRDPLIFPGTPDPLYGDFLHFACVIGTGNQTADIAFSGSGLRNVGTVHCVVSFFVSAIVLALAINVAAGLV